MHLQNCYQQLDHRDPSCSRQRVARKVWWLRLLEALPPQRDTANTTIPGGSASGGDLYQQAHQYNQAKFYQSLPVANPGYSVHQPREKMSQLIHEAERRHHMATRYQNDASEMRLDTLEQQAEGRPWKWLLGLKETSPLLKSGPLIVISLL